VLSRRQFLKFLTASSLGAVGVVALGGYRIKHPKTPSDVSFGMFNPTDSIESIIQRKLDFYMAFGGWNTGTSPIDTPVPCPIPAVTACLWTIQPSSGPGGASAANVVNWPNLIAGAYDEQIVTFANWLNLNWRQTVYVRFAHEMNGEGWYDWQVGGSCGVSSPAAYVEGFNHFATVLKAHTSFAKVVWAVASDPSANIRRFYPSECDVMGFDGYNNLGPWGSDRELLQPAYNAVAACDPDKPIWICEMGCMEPSASWTYDGVTYPAQPQYSKGSWVTTFMSSTAYPRIAAVTWFNIAKERDWIVNSSVASTNAFIQAFASTRNGVRLPTSPVHTSPSLGALGRL
jgi:hypothetical protein